MRPSLLTELVPMAATDRRFFKELGARLAQARKAQGFTQEALAAELGIAQQTLAHYEVGRLRVPASMLPALARLLTLPVEELLGVKPTPGKRGPAPRLAQHLERISELPKAKQRFVLEMLDTVLAQASR